MAQPLSIESLEWTSFITTRTSGSKLWLIKNKELESMILGCLARYREIHGAVLYAFVLMGNHYHLVARFPNMNRAKFMRDFNSSVARLVGRCVKEHGRRSVWARRYAHQILPRSEDIRHWFFYTALNPVSSGIEAKAKDYYSYNSFFDAIEQKERAYKWINWSEYSMKKRYNRNLTPEDCSKEYTLKFEKLPGNEDLSNADYIKSLELELLEREIAIAAERKSEGKGFLGIKRYLQQAIGSQPRSTKTSTRETKRPIVLTLCIKTRKQILEIYFATLTAFKEASDALRSNAPPIRFPFGTYPPPGLVTT